MDEFIEKKKKNLDETISQRYLGLQRSIYVVSERKEKPIAEVTTD